MSRAQLGTRLLIRSVVRRPTVPPRVPLAPLATLFSGHSDSFVPRLNGVLAARFRLMLLTGCRHLHPRSRALRRRSRLKRPIANRTNLARAGAERDALKGVISLLLRVIVPRVWQRLGVERRASGA